MKKEFFSIFQLVLETLAVRGKTYISTITYTMEAAMIRANISVQRMAGIPVVEMTETIQEVEITPVVEMTILERKIDEDPHFDGNAMQRELHKAIQHLPQKQRVVFNLRYFDELKYEDIAEITGTSIGALKASYHHAYNKIKDELQKKLL